MSGVKTGTIKQEAARRGGETTRDRYGAGFYEEIGAKGGRTVRDERGTEFFEEIGRRGAATTRALVAAGKATPAGRKLAKGPSKPPKSVVQKAAALLGRRGGLTVRDQRGREYYEEIGRKGGIATRDIYGGEFYEEIGRKGGLAVSALAAEGRKALAKAARKSGG